MGAMTEYTVPPDELAMQKQLLWDKFEKRLTEKLMREIESTRHPWEA